MTTRFGHETYIIKSVEETDHIIKTLKKSIRRRFGRWSHAYAKSFSKGKELLIGADKIYETEEEKEAWMNEFRAFRKEFSELTGLPDKGGMHKDPNKRSTMHGGFGIDIYYKEMFGDTEQREIDRRMKQREQMRIEAKPRYDEMRARGIEWIELD